MAPGRKAKSISKLTLALLQEGESARADFKRSPDGLSAEDLVAFANSESGGVILLGIDEIEDEQGIQRGEVRGCDVSDSSILQILNKAVSCVPPIAIDVHIENSATLPILIVEIPPSSNRPHCTAKGVYCRRDCRRNRPLHPSELLQIYLSTEAIAFAAKFETAARQITANLQDLELNLDTSIRSMSSQLGWAESQLGDTEGKLDVLISFAHRIQDASSDSNKHLRYLFNQDKREDPVKTEIRKKLLDDTIVYFSNNRKILDQALKDDAFSVQVSGKAAIELDKDDIESVVREALDFVSNQRRQGGSDDQNE